MSENHLKFNSLIFRISRYRYNFLIYMILYASLIGIKNYIAGFQLYFENYGYFFDSLNLFFIYYSFNLIRRVPNALSDLANSNVLKSEDNTKFKVFLKKSFSFSKLTNISFLLSMIYIIYAIIFYSILVDYSEYNHWGVLLDCSEVRIAMMIITSINWIFIGFWMFVGINLLGVIYLYFKSINILGTDSFPLQISYEDLKIGYFNDLGRNIIAFNIPTLLFTTALGIGGALAINIVKDLLIGLLLTISALAIMIFLVYLLYSSTISIHNAITSYKSRLKREILIQLNSEMEKNEDRNFQKINYIHNFIEHIDRIHDWPYNPSSLKKLASVMGSTLLPVVLSFIGIN